MSSSSATSTKKSPLMMFPSPAHRITRYRWPLSHSSIPVLLPAAAYMNSTSCSPRFAAIFFRSTTRIRVASLRNVMSSAARPRIISTIRPSTSSWRQPIPSTTFSSPRTTSWISTKAIQSLNAVNRIRFSGAMSNGLRPVRKKPNGTNRRRSLRDIGMRFMICQQPSGTYHAALACVQLSASRSAQRKEPRLQPPIFG